MKACQAGGLVSETAHPPTTLLWFQIDQQTKTSETLQLLRLLEEKPADVHMCSKQKMEVTMSFMLSPWELRGGLGRGSVGRVLGYHVRSPDCHTHLGMDQVIPSLRERQEG